VHYENFAPFAQVTELEREIQVSHWGVVYFEERYNLVRTACRAAGLSLAVLCCVCSVCLRGPQQLCCVGSGP
jgi:hypothetical protein